MIARPRLMEGPVNIPQLMEGPVNPLQTQTRLRNHLHKYLLYCIYYVLMEIFKLFIKSVSYIIELPQKGIERGDFKNASMRCRDAILSLKALSSGMGRVL